MRSSFPRVVQTSSPKLEYPPTAMTLHKVNSHICQAVSRIFKNKVS